MRCESQRGETGCLVIIAAIAVACQAAIAQEAPTRAGVTASGFVDSYFSLNLARPASRTNRFRNFDINESQFDVALAELVFQTPADPLGFRIDADFGSANDVVHGGMETSLTWLQQAYLSALIPLGSGLTVDAGKYVTHLGFEVIESRDNWNYSRSFLFAYAIPYFHTGIRLTYPVSGAVSVLGSVMNGWNSMRDNNRSKTFGAGLILNPSPELTLMAGWIGGEEQPDSAGVGARHVFDASVAYRPTDRLSLAVNASLGREDLVTGNAGWQGIALYARYTFGRETGVAVRLENYDDRDGHTTGVPQSLREVTLTVEQSVLKFLVIRAEYRHDRSTEAVFEHGTGPGALLYQNTLTLGATVAF